MEFDVLQLGMGEQLALLGVYLYILYKSLTGIWATALALASIVGFYFYLKYRWDFWKRHGIDGPPGSILFGHLPMLRRGFNVVDTEWTERYGKIFGYNGLYTFGQPDLVVSDPEVLRHVLVKDFVNFTNRRIQAAFSPKNEKTDSLLSNNLASFVDDHWKNVRNTITPAFTTGKMKNLVPLVNDCLHIVDGIITDHVEKRKNLDLKEICGNLTMDAIAKSAFGMDIDAQRDKSSPFIKYAKQLFEITFTSPRFIFMVLFPHVVRELQGRTGWILLFADGNAFFKKALQQIIRERRKTPKTKNPDFLQLLLNAQDDKIDKSDVDKEISHTEIAVTGKKVPLTELEVMSQSMVFIMAGYETSATTLHFALYLLAVHLECQDRCLEEVERVMGTEDEIQFDHVSPFHYVDQVICETLRLYPPAQRFDRQCSKDTRIGDLVIPEGCIVSVPVWVIHHDPELYPDPDKFNPERFSASERAARDPLSYMPFGYGPRNCIGMRFAQLEMRMALAYLVRHFRFFPVAETEKFPPKLYTARVTKPEKALVVGAERRR